MRGLRKITNFSISTVSTEPLRGIVEIDTFDSAVKFELSEDTALNICADLEHFLTQGSPGGHAECAPGPVESPKAGRRTRPLAQTAGAFNARLCCVRRRCRNRHYGGVGTCDRSRVVAASIA